MSKMESLSVIYVKCGKSMFKKIKLIKTTKKLPETIDLSWEAQEKFQAKVRKELKKRPIKKKGAKHS